MKKLKNWQKIRNPEDPPLEDENGTQIEENEHSK